MSFRHHGLVLRRVLSIGCEGFRLSTLSTLSIAASWFFWCAEGYSIPGGSKMFMDWSWDLLGTMPPYLAQRDVGFPFLIWLSGYSRSGSLRGITLIYAEFAAAMPLLVYLTLHSFSKWIGWLAALATILSVGPWMFAKLMYPDEACIFGMALSLALLCRYLASGRTACLYGFTAASLFLSVTRPAMNAVFPCLMLVAIVFGPHGSKTYQAAGDKPQNAAKGERIKRVHWFSVLGCIGAFALGIVVYHEYRARVFNAAALGYTPSYTGEQVFYDPYVNSAEFGLLLDPSIGPNLAKVNQRLIEVIGPSTQSSKILHDLADQNPPDFAQTWIFTPTPEDLLFRIWHMPNYEYGQLIDGVVDDATLLQAAIEIGKAHPFYIVRYVSRNLWDFLWDPGWAHTRGNALGYVYTGLSFYPEALDLREAGLFPKPAIDEANQPRLYGDTMALVSVYWHWGYSAFIWITTGLMFAGWVAVISAPFLFSRAFLGSFIAANGLFLYNALIVSAFADPDFRYSAMCLVLRATVAGFGLVAISPKRRAFRPLAQAR